MVLATARIPSLLNVPSFAGVTAEFIEHSLSSNVPNTRQTVLENIKRCQVQQLWERWVAVGPGSNEWPNNEILELTSLTVPDQEDENADEKMQGMSIETQNSCRGIPTYRGIPCQIQTAPYPTSPISGPFDNT